MNSEHIIMNTQIQESVSLSRQVNHPVRLPLIHPSVYLEHSKPQNHLSLGTDVQGIKMLLLTGSEKGNM